LAQLIYSSGALALQWLNYSDFYIEKDEKKKINAIDKNLLGGEKVKKNFKYNLSSKILKNSLEKIRKKDNKRARQVYSFYEGLKETINEINKKMKKNSYQFWVVGNRTVKKETLMTDKILVEMAKNCGLEYVCKVGRNIPNKVMPSLNSPTNEVGEKMNTMINEHIVVLRK